MDTPNAPAASALAAPGVRQSGWDRLILVAALGLAVALLYWPSVVALAGFWGDTVDRAYTHGYLVLLMSLWLIFRDRRRLAAAPLQVEPRALVLLLVLSAAWLWFWRAAVQDLHLLLLPLLWFVACFAVLGRHAARRLLFPIGFLYFAMPVWSDLVDILQRLSVAVNSALIWLTGLPAYVSGNIVHVPAGALEIAEGCSGLHFFVVGLALAALYGELARDSRRRRLLWFAMMGALSLIANWVRIFVIVVAGYVTNMHSYLITVDHYWFGWGVFVVFFVGFLWLAGRFASRWDLREAARRGPGTRATPTAPHETPVQERRPSGSARVSLVAGVAALACVAILPTLVYATDPLRAAGAVRIVWAPAMEPWTGPQPSSDAGWQPQFAQASAQGQRQYVDPQGRSVQIYIVAYRAQRQGAKLLGYGNSLLGEQGGLRTTREQVLRSVSGAWREQRLIDERGGESLLWSRYRVGARSFAYPRVSQLWYGIASLVSPAVSSLTALRAACQPDCAAARKRLAEVARTMQPALALQTSQEPARRAADDSAGRPIP